MGGPVIGSRLPRPHVKLCFPWSGVLHWFTSGGSREGEGVDKYIQLRLYAYIHCTVHVKPTHNAFVEIELDVHNTPSVYANTRLQAGGGVDLDPLPPP